MILLLLEQWMANRAADAEPNERFAGNDGRYCPEPNIQAQSGENSEKAEKRRSLAANSINSMTARDNRTKEMDILRMVRRGTSGARRAWFWRRWRSDCQRSKPIPAVGWILKVRLSGCASAPYFSSRLSAMLPPRPPRSQHWRRFLPRLLLVAVLVSTLAVSVAIASDDGRLPAPDRGTAATQSSGTAGERATRSSTPAPGSAARSPASAAGRAPTDGVATPDSAAAAAAPPGNRFANSVAGLRATDFASAEDELPVLDWLELDAEVLADWNIQTVPDNPATLIVTPKWKSVSSDDRSILVLIPIKSEVYSIAISTSLSLFREKSIGATFTIVNYGSIEDYGLALLEQAKRDRIDLILATGSRATDLAYENFRNESLPVVGNTKDPVLLGQVAAYDQGSGTNIAYTTFSVPFKTLQTYLLQLKPDLANVAILYAEENRSAVETQVEPMVALTRALGIKAHRYGVKDRTNAATELVNLIPQAVADMRRDDPELQNSIFFLTGSVSVYREIATINQYAEQVPVIATLPDVVSEGDDSATISIGGHFRNTSYITSLYAIRILRNEIAPGDLPVGLVTPPDVAINFRRVQAVDAQIPFTFFEAASFVYDYKGESVRTYGQNVQPAT